MANSKVKLGLPKVSNYVKNVGKSLGYAAVDAVKNHAPGISEFVEDSDNTELLKTAYSSVKNIRETMKRVERNTKQSKIFDAIEYGLKNIKEDIKTGNFYNKAREDEAGVSEFMGDDMDFDIDFSFDDDSISTSSNQENKSNSFDKAIGAAANAQALATKEGTSLVVQSNILNTKVMIGEFSKVNASIGSVYGEISQVNSFLKGPMQTHLENSKLYFEQSTKLLQDQAMMLKELLEMQRNLYTKKSEEYKESALSKSMSYNGNINLRGYIGNVKNNIKNIADSYGLSMLSMMSDMGEGNALKTFTANPLGPLLTMLVEGTMSKGLKRSLASFDKSLTSMFSQFVAKINKKSNDYGPMSIISEIFGIRLDKKDKIDTSRYEKGPVPFDGITRKTIIEVIPGYLARIEAALTGNEERHYDTNSGKWKNASQIKSAFKDLKGRAIVNANWDIRGDLSHMFSTLNPRDKKAMENQLDAMLMQIFEDGGDFTPAFENGSKYGKRKSGKLKNGQDAYKYYKFRNKDDFDKMLSFLTDDTIKSIAKNNMEAIESYSKTLRNIEKNGGIFNILANGTYPDDKDKSKNKNNKIYGTGVLASSMDNNGNNVFYYLKEILKEIKGRHRSGSNTTTNNIANNNSIILPNGSRSRESETSEDDGEPPSGSIDWSKLEEEKRKQEEEEAKKKQLGNKVKEKFSKTKVGKFLYDSGSTVGRILAAPIDYATKLLDKADQSIFKMMFGTNEYKDDEGNRIDSIFEYMMYRVKKSFKEMTDWLKTQIFDPIKEKYLKPLWEKYGKPITNELKGYAKRGWNRIKRGADNTFGRGFRSIKNKLLTGEVLSVEEIKRRGMSSDIAEDRLNNIVDTFDYEEGQDPREILNNARGGLVTKRGLTMISPGEMIIPASFDKKIQDKQLAREKKDGKEIKRLLGLDNNKLGYNAKGTTDSSTTINYEKYKDKIEAMLNEAKNKDKAAKIGAGGVLGLGGALLTGINPILGAMAGAGLSFVTETEAGKNFLFGKELENGTREGGVIPKKAIDFISKYGSDMADFGIAGGILGLVSPFGVLGGAALGAGIGFLKNNESFNKFIFGDEETGKKGLITKETANKVKGFIKKHVPATLVGAGVGMLTGPFGLLGNAVLGSGLGLLTTTDKFKEFLFGKDVEVTTADGETKTMKTGGFLTAIKNGIMKPVQKEMEWFADNFKEFAQKHVLNPLKRFWEPFTNAIKNTILSVGERIKDHLNDMFEKKIGIPLSDFIRERVFKPLSSGIMKLLKFPYTIAKMAIGAPAHLLGFSGDNLRSHQINAGTADYMTAAERIQWRKDHDIRNGLGFDTHRQEDEALVNMSEEQLQSLVDLSRAGMSTRSQLSRQLGSARQEVGEAVSAYMNTNGLYSRKTGLGYGKVNKAVKLGTKGNFDALERLINKSNMTDVQKQDLLKIIKDKSSNALDISRALDMYDTDKDKRDAMMQDLIGHKFSSRNEYRKFTKYAETELADRKKNKVAQQNESPETHATYTLADIYKEKTDKMIKFWEKTNDYLRAIVDPKFAKELLKKEKKEENETEFIKPEEIGTDKGKKKSSKIRSKKTGAAVGVTSVANTANPVIVDPDSKEAKEAEAEKEKKDKLDQEGNTADKEQVSILQKLHDKMFGKDKKDKKEKKGILGKIFGGAGGLIGGIASGIGSLLNFLGAGGKYVKIGALALAGIPLFGYASEWFKTSIWPKMKETFIGTNEKPGLLHGLTKWFGEKFNKVKDWITSGGAIKWITDGFVKAIPNLVAGVGYVINKVVAPLTTAIVKALPSLLWNLTKGLLGGLKEAIFPSKDLPNSNQYNAELSVDNAISDINSFGDANNADLVNKVSQENLTMDQLFNSSSSNASKPESYTFGGSTNNNGSGRTTHTTWGGQTVEGNEIEADGRSARHKTQSGIDSVLGGYTNTNIVDFDENGNPVTRYSQMNHEDSALQKIGKASGRSFINTLSGLSKNGPIAGKLLSKLTGKGVGGGAMALVTGGASLTGKATGMAINGSSKTAKGLRVFAGLDEATEQAAKKGLLGKAVDAAGKTNIGQKIINGLKSVFSSLANSKIGGIICEQISKWCGTELTQKVLDKTLKKAAEKLANKVCGKLASKALNGIVKALAGFSPLAIVTLVTDFYDGFDNADTYLGVAKGDELYHVNIGQKCLCGLLNVINNKVTLGLIPLETLIDVFTDIVFPIFNIDASELKAAQERAQSVIDEWNKNNPDQTYDNLEDYNNKDKLLETLGRSLFGTKKVVESTTNSSINGKKIDPNAKNNIIQPIYDKNKAIQVDSLMSGLNMGDYTRKQITKKSGKRRNIGFARNGGNGSIMSSLSSIMQYPINGLTNVAKDIAGDINRLISGIRDNSKENKNIIKKATSGVLSVTSAAYWKLPNDNDNVINIFNNVMSTIERLMNSAIIGISNISDNIQDNLKSAVNKAKKSVSSGLAAVANLGKSITSGSSRNRFGLAHTYQNDPSIAGMKYGDSTIGEAGCGPVAAANLLNDSVSDAARYAERKGMTVPGGGTDIRYFDSYLRDNGMNTSRTTNKSQVLSALKNGDQAVMLGADGDPNGPFGTTPHFVTAKGLDSHGNIIAEDPDLPQSRMVYNSRNMLNNMDAAVIAKRGSKRNKVDEKARRKDREFFRKMSSKDKRFNKYGRAREENSGSVSTQSTYIPGSGQTVKGLGIKTVNKDTAAKSWMNKNNMLSGKNLGPQAVLNVARSQIGYTDGGSNYTKYHKAMGWSGAAPWCVMFVWWCFNQAGAAKLFCNGQKSAGCSNTRSYYSNGSSGELSATPQVGDMVLFVWGGSGPDHIGIVEAVNDDGSITTIEGNTSSNGSQDNGGCVERKTRYRNELYSSTPFMRPRWPYDYDASSVVDMSKYGDSTDYKSVAIKGGGMTGDISSTGDGSESSSEESQDGTLVTALKNLGTSMVKKIYGEEAYNALFGTSTSDSSSSSSYTSSGTDSDWMNLDKETRTKKIWDYLIKNGYDKAAAAGMMGNWEMEGQCNPNGIECDYLYKSGTIPGIDKATDAAKSNDLLDKYTLEHVFPAYARSGVSLAKNAYKGTDGHWYPGFGLIGWTGPNAQKLLEFSKSINKDWRRLDTQLDMINTEKDKIQAAINGKSASDAAAIYARKFENSQMPSSWVTKRQGFANDYYRKFAGGKRNADMFGMARDIDTISKSTPRPRINTSNLGQNTNYLNSQRYSNTLNSTVNRLQSMPTIGSGDYGEFLKVIVSVLMSIADNTSVLQKILEILSNNFNINLKSSDIDKAAHNKTKAQTQAALNELISRTTGNTVNLSKLINNKDTDYVLNAMIAIASE